jgi:hypothetical protein
MEPHAIPEQPLPVTLQTTTPLCPLALNWIWPPGLICGEPGEIVSVGVETMVICAEPDRLGAATEVAVAVTVGGEGTLAGAVYKPELDIEPHPAPLHPDKLQVTDVFVVPVTVAENCCCFPVDTCAVAGDTVTETEEAASMTTLAEADFVGSATEVAVTEASAGLGIVAGEV